MRIFFFFYLIVLFLSQSFGLRQDKSKIIEIITSLLDRLSFFSLACLYVWLWLWLLSCLSRCPSALSINSLTAFHLVFSPTFIQPHPPSVNTRSYLSLKLSYRFCGGSFLQPPPPPPIPPPHKPCSDR